MVARGNSYKGKAQNINLLLPTIKCLLTLIKFNTLHT